MRPSYYVYRLIGPGNSLLYIGCTGDITERVRRHRSTSTFGHLIESYAAEAYESRDEALAAERTAIRRESPIFNDRLSSEPAPVLRHGLGDVLWSLIQRAALSLDEVGLDAGIGRRRLRRILAEPNAMRLSELTRIAELLGTTAGAIVTEFERGDAA